MAGRLLLRPTPARSAWREGKANPISFRAWRHTHGEEFPLYPASRCRLPRLRDQERQGSVHPSHGLAWVSWRAREGRLAEEQGWVLHRGAVTIARLPS